MSLKSVLKRCAKFLVYGQPVINKYVSVAHIYDNKLLAGKKILVTGGTSGIGLSVAKKIIAAGGEVIITGRSQDKLNNALKEIDSNNCKAIVFDIANITSIKSKFLDVVDLSDGKLDAVVSNAGIYKQKNFFDYTLDDYTRTMDTNFTGAFFLAQATIKYWLDNHIDGNLVFVSSERGIMSDVHPYGLSKVACNSFVEGLAKQYGVNDIRVNAVAPGITATNINNINPDGNLWFDKRRIMRPEEIAEVVKFLLSDASKCVNGQIVACNEAYSVNMDC